MAGRRLRRTSVLGVAVALAIGSGAAVAEGAGALRGSPVAVRVAQQVLAHVRHVAAIEWHQGGDQWECPSPEGPILGPAVRQPERGCHRATVTLEENLRNGRIMQSLATTTGPGLRTSTELVSREGDWMRSAGARCWDAQGQGLIEVPAFSYTGERLSIVARTPDVVTLRGVDRDYRETDTIDGHTFAVRQVDERVPAIGGSATLTAQFTELPHWFALPAKPRHVCSDIVRFPPQRPR